VILSMPLTRLKRRAKTLKRAQGLSHSEALDHVAREKGFPQWSFLAAEHAKRAPSRTLLKALSPGDMALIAGRPGQGKTLLGLEIVAEACLAGRVGVVFTLEMLDLDVLERLRWLEVDPVALSDRLILDTSDAICADYIVERCQGHPTGSVILIDYLQLLDQRRDVAALCDQVRVLHKRAKDWGHIILCLSQVDRRFEVSDREVPTVQDLRLPNPVDLNLFSRKIFLREGQFEIADI